MKDPVKYARKELVKYGAQVVLDRGHMIDIQLPQGGRLVVEHRTPLAKVKRFVEAARLHSNPVSGYVAFSGASPLNGRRVTVSPHFLDRFELMAEQENLSHSEIDEALRRPTRVWVRGRRYALERGRVIVVAYQHDNRAVLLTALWANEELWARNPRPEEETS